jgi:hypothetical protein
MRISNLRSAFNHQYNFPYWIFLSIYCFSLSLFLNLIYSHLHIRFFAISSWFINSTFSITIINIILFAGILFVTILLDLLMLFVDIFSYFPLLIVLIISSILLLYLTIKALNQITKPRNSFFKIPIFALIYFCSFSGGYYSFRYIQYLIN